MNKKEITKLLFECCEEVIEIWAKPKINKLESEIALVKEEIKKIKGGNDNV